MVLSSGMDAAVADSALSLRLGKFRLTRRDCSLPWPGEVAAVFGCYCVPEQLHTDVQRSLLAPDTNTDAAEQRLESLVVYSTRSTPSS